MGLRGVPRVLLTAQLRPNMPFSVSWYVLFDELTNFRTEAEVHE